ncbi:MAG TPA: glycosyltransferase family 4 protein [Solirubrobacteraceae bacterium]|jgi:glycosyltransferase involved in cell wall biosynthesis
MSGTPGRRLLMIEQGGRGGVTDYTIELVRALAAEGWAVTLATAEDHTFPPIEGVTIRRVFHYVRGDTQLGRALRRYGLGRVANGLRFLLALPRLMRLARRADVVHTQGWEVPQIGLVAVACLRMTGTPLLETAHNTFERPDAGAFLRTRNLVARLTSRLTARTIVHTQADLGRLAGWRDGAVVIPHGEYGGLASRGGGADRAQARAALGIPELAPATLMFGQLRTDKGLPDLVEAVRRLPSLHLLIGGQDLGGLAEVRDELATAGLEGRVTLREGFLDMREAATLFAAADTVALPYRTASQSGVLLLAYGFARPVVVYPRGGMVEAVIDGETGWICTAADVDALTRALLASIEAGPEECLRRGERGRALARERYAWPAVAGLTTEVYDDVIARS